MNPPASAELPQRPWRIFNTREALAATLAAQTAQALKQRVASHGHAALAVSGGSTPKLFLELLSEAPLHWPAIDVTLVDERWIDSSSDRSNEKLIRTCLLRGAAQVANFVPLKNADTRSEMALDEIEVRLRRMPLPFAAVILGMGEDGHTASFFPQGDRLLSALDPQGERAVESIRAPGALEPRVTLTFPMLNAADYIALHIEGEAKRRALSQAEQNGPIEAMPIRAFLREARPIDIFWAA
jgi:6-phosphogluconolactonase